MTSKIERRRLRSPGCLIKHIRRRRCFGKRMYRHRRNVEERKPYPDYKNAFSGCDAKHNPSLRPEAVCHIRVSLRSSNDVLTLRRSLLKHNLDDPGGYESKAAKTLHTFASPGCIEKLSAKRWDGVTWGPKPGTWVCCKCRQANASSFIRCPLDGHYKCVYCHTI